MPKSFSKDGSLTLEESIPESPKAE